MKLTQDQKVQIACAALQGKIFEYTGMATSTNQGVVKEAMDISIRMIDAMEKSLSGD